MLATVLLAFLAVAAATTSERTPVDYLGSPCTGAVCDNGMECLTVGGGECNWDGYSADAPCSCGGAGGESDPYFTGFSGQSFYFRAEAGNAYNIYSDETHLVNARFVSTELPQESDLLSLVSGAQNSSFIDTVFIQRGSTTVKISSDRLGELAVKINGEELRLGSEASGLEAKLRVAETVFIYVEQYPQIFGTSVTVETDLLALNIYPERAHVDNMGNTVRGHLSLQMSLKVATDAMPQAAHGVLGQTVDPQRHSEIEDGFPGEGEASDYIVSSLSAWDFKFNAYGVKPEARAPAAAASTSLASRRLLGGRRQTGEVQLLDASFGSQYDAHRRSEVLRRL